MKETDAYEALRLAPLQMGCESLALILAAHLAMLTALLASPKYSAARVLRAAKEIGRIIRRQLKVQYRLMSQALQEELKVNPNFRAQVARDLGGKLAMVKWERRRRDAQTHAAFKAARQAQGFDLDPQLNNFHHSFSSNDLINYNVSSGGNPINSDFASEHQFSLSKHAPHFKDNGASKRWQPITDRTGHFRWAVIASGPRKKPRRISERRVAINRAPNRPFQPHGLTADDLRTPAFPSSEFGPPFNPQGMGMPLVGVSPPIERWPKQTH